MSTALVRQGDRSLVSRRGFLKRTAAAVVGLAAAKLLPAPAVQFASDAFASAFEKFDQVCRFDVLFGWQVIRPELAIRVVADADDDYDYAIDVKVLRSELVYPEDHLPITMRKGYYEPWPEELS